MGAVEIKPLVKAFVLCQTDSKYPKRLESG